jgi:hypothetical protein
MILFSSKSATKVNKFNLGTMLQGLLFYEQVKEFEA